MNIGIPVINRGDLLEACVNSIDVPTERVVIVANRWGADYEPSVAGALNRLAESHPACVGSLEIVETGGNLGDGGSFNRVMTELGPCIVASNDAVFLPGALGQANRFIHENADCALLHLYAMCVFAVTRAFFEEAGYFDENFWPWGWCDIDLGYRMQKRECKTRTFAAEGGGIVHDHPTQSIKSAQNDLRKWMQQMAGRNAEYGMRKWGLTEEPCTIKTYNEKEWANKPDVVSVPVNISVTLLHALHRRWVALLEAMSEEQFMNRKVFHPERQMEMTLWFLVGMYAWHCRHHVAHIKTLKEQKGW